MPSKPSIQTALDQLAMMYREVDRMAGGLQDIHKTKLKCQRGCCDCCVDSITVFEIEARYIWHHCADVLQREPPHPSGACAFLDDWSACRIYPYRPYVCRTQGLPLRWIETDPSGEPVELRDICPLNQTQIQVEQLDPAACWLIGPFESRLATIQHRLGRGRLERVSLRSLFHREPT